MRMASRLALMGMSAIALSAHAGHQQKSAVLMLGWKAGTTISVCSSAGGKCAVMDMPATVGQVDRVIVQKFIPDSPLSWLAIGKSQVHLCTIGAATEPSVHCARLSNQFARLTLNVTETTYGGDLRWVVLGDRTRAERLRITNELLTQFAKARHALSVYRRPAGDMAVQSVMLPGGGTDGCTEDFDDPYCEGGTGAGNGSGDGGGGTGTDAGNGGGEGGAGQIPVPPPVLVPTPPAPIDPDIPVVIVTPTPSQPSIPSSEPPWYCRWFGIFCPDYVPPPPRENPPAPPQPTPTPPSVPVSPEPPQPIPRYAEGYEEAIQECLDQNMRDMEECSAYYGMYGSPTWIACKERASHELAQCQSEARDAYRLPD